MCKRLRKISKGVPRFSVDFFGEKVDIVGITKRRFVNFARFIQFPTALQKICLPKTAERESALAQFETTFVSINQSSARNYFFANPGVRFLHSFGNGIFKSVIGEQKRACIDNIAATSL